MLEPGQTIPDVSLVDADGTPVRLRDLLGERVLVVYFYPKDDTPGCTKQACNLRDQYRDLLDAGIAVIGVSADDVASHDAFAGKYDLPFPLVADPDRKILERYGVWGKRSLYGRIFFGVKRTTFLIDEEGVIRHVIKRPAVDQHGQEILKKFGF